MNTFLNSLDWRFATKAFDTNKKVSAEDIQKIKDAIRMAPTSFGLQPFRVIVIEDQELKNKLKPSSFNQSQIDTNSHLFVFVSNSDVQKRIGEYCDLAETKSKGLLNRVAMETGMRAAFAMRNDEAKMRWATNQTYIALGFGLAACAELRIDSAPMEGFMSDSYKDILGLKENEYAAVIMAVGYRAEDPSHEKTRFADEVIFESK